MPPPSTLSILNLLPTRFSALSLGLTRTNLSSAIEAAVSASQGGTFFAPSNTAFDFLGPRISSFLFSAQGEKYLRALLEYHVVRNQTLYSDVLYTKDGRIERLLDSQPPSSPSPPSDAFHLAQMIKSANLPQMSTHIELPTMLGNRTIAVDIKQRGSFSKLMINGYQHSVAAIDGVTRDGSIIVLDNFLIPSKKNKSARHVSRGMRYFRDENDRCDTLEEFKARFAGLVMDDGNGDDFESDLFAFLDSPSS